MLFLTASFYVLDFVVDVLVCRNIMDDNLRRIALFAVLSSLVRPIYVLLMGDLELVAAYRAIGFDEAAELLKG